MPLNTIPNKGLTSRGYPSDRLVTPIIINGDMSAAQRSTSETGVTSGTYKTIDRFRIIISGAGTWTLTQSDTVPTGQGFYKSFKYDCTTADASLAAGDVLGMSQKIEGYVQAPIKKGTANAEKTTLSFWVRSNKTGTYICELFDDQNTRQVSKSYTINSADTWEKKVIVFPADTVGANDFDNTQAMQVNWWLAAGSDYTSGTLSETWTASTNANRMVGQVNLADSTDNEWYCTGVQLEVGEFDSTTIPSFPFESFESNLRKCQRYFAKQSGDNATILSSGTFYTTNGWLGHLKYTTTMRTGPSLSTSGAFKVRNASGDSDASSIQISGDAGLDSLSLQATATGTSGDGGVFRTASSGGSLSLDAEL